jgi:GH15 family glucan-1,4-alpha-glucosidase
MRGIDGREQELGHLTGYRGSPPVRIGNAAAKQLQLDIYGELMDSVGLYDDWYGPISSAQRDAITTRTERVCDHWLQTDEGVCESGGGPKKFCTRS